MLFVFMFSLLFLVTCPKYPKRNNRKISGNPVEKRKKQSFFETLILSEGHVCFTSMYSVLLLNTLSEYTDFYILKSITLYTFLLVFKILESLQCIFKRIQIEQF